MKENGLVQGENGLELYVMCEIPSNVISADAFADIFDGFSIGSNDLTQLTYGLDRDSGLIAGIADERDESVKDMIRMVIATAKRRGKKIGICGQGPSDFPEFATVLVELGIDSMSLIPDTAVKTRLAVADKEKEIARLEKEVDDLSALIAELNSQQKKIPISVLKLIEFITDLF